MEMIKRLLFLDDIRYPIEAYQYTKQNLFLRKDWHIVRNYDQFVNRIQEKGLPEMISFDHDLGKINVYEYIYFLSLHAQRHITQMENNQSEMIKN